MNKFIVVVFTLIAAASVATAPAFAGNPIKIGSVLPFSGPATSWGVGLSGIVEMLADEINAAGGLEVKGDKHKIQVIRYDDKYNANEAVSVMNRLIHNDGVKFALTLGSASTLAITPAATENKIMMLTVSFSNRVVTKDAPYTFRVITPSTEFAYPQINWVVKKLQIKKVGALFPNDETGQQIAKDLASPYSANGVKMEAQFFERDRLDFVPLITRLMAAGVEAIDLDGNAPATSGLILKQAREAGFTGPVIATGGEATVAIIDVAGAKAAEGLYVHLPANATDPAVVKLKNAFESRFNTPMTLAAVSVYSGAQLLFKAIQKTGSVDDVPAISKAMESLNDETTMLGQIGWTGKNDLSGAVYENGHQMVYPFYVGQVKDGKVTIAATCNQRDCR